MDLSLFFAGTGGSVPSPRRGLPAILLRRGGDRLLFDCGEGTQRQLMRSAGLADLNCIFITHFHADHWLGIPGMLKSFALREREQPLTIYGPRGLNKVMEDTRFIYGRPPYPLRSEELEPGEVVRFDGYEVTGVPVKHKGASAFGYAIVEQARPGHLDPQLAEQLGVTPGPDFGKLTRGETVNGVSPEQVMGPTREGRKIVISGDTSPCEALKIAAHEADVLVHEATFAEEEAERAAQTGHSTALQAAALARDANVRLLALTHISSRYPGGDLREQAREVFAATEAPRDFDSIEIPFPEKGPAELVRWSRRAASEQTSVAEGAEDTTAESAAPASDSDPANSTESKQPDAQPVAPR
ncbi:MAG TPA: ribonuclease Z [Solirubrobacteraceae bacterium]|jgi:ribonuclease Z|nr:ribonuclease Z [Solirubrobacteraceae bacterium]